MTGDLTGNLTGDLTGRGGCYLPGVVVEGRSDESDGCDEVGLCRHYQNKQHIEMEIYEDLILMYIYR